MSHFLKVAWGLDVAPLVSQIEAQPELWNQHRYRKDAPCSPHALMDDIWLRYNDYALAGDREAFYAPHIPVWYPAWKLLPAARPIIFGLMSLLQAEALYGCFITRVPAGCSIGPHADQGWHVNHTEKLFVALESPEGSAFCCLHDGELDKITPAIGDVHLFDNRKQHWVVNESGEAKMTLIISVRTDVFGRY